MGAPDLQIGNGMQYGGYEDDLGMGSGAETPELENEHPLSRQTSAQAPSALMAMLTVFQNQHEGPPCEQMDASRRLNAIAHGPAEYFGIGAQGQGQGGHVQSMYAGGVVDGLPFVVPQGACPDGAWQSRTVS